jgi:DNA-directed RNA polymerase alpha subunit
MTGKNCEVRSYFMQHTPEEHRKFLLVRTVNCLIRGGIKTMDELCAMSTEQLYRVHNAGEKCVWLMLLVREKYMAERIEKQ